MWPGSHVTRQPEKFLQAKSANEDQKSFTGDAALRWALEQGRILLSKGRGGEHRSGQKDMGSSSRERATSGMSGEQHRTQLRPGALGTRYCSEGPGNDKVQAWDPCPAGWASSGRARSRSRLQGPGVILRLSEPGPPPAAAARRWRSTPISR